MDSSDYEWSNAIGTLRQPFDSHAYTIYRDLYRILSNSVKQPEIHFSKDVKDILMEGADEELSPVGKIIQRFNDEFLFLAPDKVEVVKFIETFPCSDRLQFIKRSLENYINGKTDIIIEK